MAWDARTTWLGYLGGGGSAALIAGGGVYQFEVWNVGGKALPTRVYVTSKKVGLMAHAGVSHAMVLVTGCSTARDMDGITSSGIDWEFDIGASAKSLKASGKFAKYQKLFETVETMAKAGNKTVRAGTNWAGHEAGKRLAQATMGDLGVVQGTGPQFNVLPSPLSLGIGAGLVYDWQKMHVMGGKQAWSMISPNWYVENTGDGLRLQMYDIPEQDGTQIKVAIGVDEWGIDPLIRWDSLPGGPRVDRRKQYQILGHVYGGWLWETADSKTAGINLGKLKPSGRLEAGMLSVSTTRTVKKGGSMKIYPEVMHFTNYPYWSADDSVTVKLGADGRFMSSAQAGKVRD